MLLSFQECYRNGIIKYDFGIGFFPPLSVILWKFTHSLQVSVIHTFILLRTVSWFRCASLTICPLKDIWLVWVIMNKAAVTFVYKFLCEHTFLFLWNKCLNIRELGLTVPCHVL